MVAVLINISQPVLRVGVAIPCSLLIPLCRLGLVSADTAPILIHESYPVLRLGISLPGSVKVDLKGLFRILTD